MAVHTIGVRSRGRVKPVLGTATRVCDMSVNAQPEPMLLDTAAAAAVVGVNTGVIRGWCADGLPFIRAGRGGKKWFTRRDLEKHIERLKETTE